MLYVLCWRKTCCLLKSAQERTFAHAGLCGHHGDIQAAHIRVLKPLLNLEYGFIAMVQLWREVRVETLLAARNIHKIEPGSSEHNGRTQGAIDKFQSQIAWSGCVSKRMPRSLISSGKFRTSRLKWLISPPSLLAAKS